jgi:hypothetical protein
LQENKNGGIRYVFDIKTFMKRRRDGKWRLRGLWKLVRVCLVVVALTTMFGWVER